MGVPEANIAPMRRQYLQIKERYPDTILLFRLGDFYETFERDAEIAAAVLDITLTGREMGKGVRVPMAGIPHHASDIYIARLVGAGHKVAICEQVGDVVKGRGIVERDVTRVVTPGTVVDPAMLEAHRNNYVAGVAIDGRRVGVAAADITTGEFIVTELNGASAEEALLAAGRELLRLSPSEVVLAAGDADEASLPRSSWLPAGAAISGSERWRWTVDRSGEALRRHFAVDSLDGFGCSAKPLAIRAAGGLLQYLADTQLQGLAQITSLATYSIDGFMTLDAQTRRNLELLESGRGEKKHSLVAVLDQTRTAMGARLLRRWLGQPLLDVAALRQRQDGVETLLGDPLRRAETRVALGAVGDIERLANRIVTGLATPRDLAALRTSLRALPSLAALAQGVAGMPAMPDLGETLRYLDDALVDDPPAALGKGPVFRAGFAPDLDGHRLRANEARDWIANLERTERERTGIRSLKVGYNKVFGYYLEITAAALANADRERMTTGIGGTALPVDYIPKQTLANATRYFTPLLKEYETVVLTAEETLAAIELDAYRRLLAEVAGQAPHLLAAAATIAHLDVLACLADVAAQRRYVRPELDESGVIDIEAGRHPTLETLLAPGEYVPNDARLDPGSTQIVILTGPNMAGKSSWLRQVALIVLLAQIGSFVPANRAQIGIVDRIFTRIGAQDDIATGQSTFMVEMLETANILNHASPRSLVVLDEIGRGTSTWDGLAIARAIVEHLHNAPRLGCKTIFATHYHELTELEAILPRVAAYRMAVLEQGDQVVFLRQVTPGGADRSYGIHVAQLAGIPGAIVRRAREILDDLERGDHKGPMGPRSGPVTGLPPREAAPVVQMTLFAPPDPVVDELRRLDVDGLTPLDALMRLYELQRKVREHD